MFEGITRGTRRHVYGNARDNETPVAELQYDITVVYRSSWEPEIFDDLLTVDIKTGMKPGDSQTEMDKRIQAHLEILLQSQRRTSSKKENSHG
jgi:hypothetical protein